MKNLYLIVCDTDIDRYASLRDSDKTESFENAYQVYGSTQLEQYIDLTETLDNYNLDFELAEIENLETYF